MATDSQPRIGIIGGSGLAHALLANHAAATPIDLDTPFGKPSAPILLADYQNIPIAILPRHGTHHTIPPTAVPFRANIYALKQLHCKWILASGAVGSLREQIAPRDLVIPDQLIDKTTQRISTFFDVPGAAVHTEFANPFCERLHQILLTTAASLNITPAKIHSAGTYICMEGPAFSTRAESLLHRQWGGDLIGMTASPEAKLAREAEISYALIALATDYDSWKSHDPSQNKEQLLTEIIANMHAATVNALTLLEAALPQIWATRNEAFPSHRALELAIWTNKSQIPAETKSRVALLWSKYL
jgi:5'-methylthioadenosine phosphorylase